MRQLEGATLHIRQEKPLQFSEEASTMPVLAIFSLFMEDQERENGLLMQVQCESSLTDGILLFYSGINCKKDDKFI